MDPTQKSSSPAPSQTPHDAPVVEREGAGGQHVMVDLSGSSPEGPPVGPAQVEMMLTERDRAASDELSEIVNRFSCDFIWCREWVAAPFENRFARIGALIDGPAFVKPWIALAFMKRWGWWPHESVDGTSNSRKLACAQCGAMFQRGARVQILQMDPLEVVHAGTCPE